ncbi:AMP-binding protein [Myxococcota bacterium]|nr:AMP-binding protein [Myxococcota bacterium]MBU1381552.1 AMP-binding protein [Myxococcota bacterium]MBU1495446.1 AMP-binding protein [Myxococcota bacterium]
MNLKSNISPDSPWFSETAGWPDEVSRNPEFPVRPLDSIISDAASRWPSNRAARFLGMDMTYGEYNRYVDAFADSLYKLGIKKGETVAILLPNSFQYMISYFAIMRIGAIVSGINPTYKPLEIKHQLETVKAKYLIFLDALYKEKIEPIKHDISIKVFIGTNIADFLPWHKQKLGKLLKKIPSAPLPSDAVSFTSLLKSGKNPPAIEIDPVKDPATYIMTGGTTGVPKAAVLTHYNILCNALQVRMWFYRSNQNIANLGILPFFHAFGMTAIMNLTPLYGGWVLLFPRPPKMEELCASLEKDIPKEGTIFIGAEVLFQRMADFPDLKKYKIARKLFLGVSGAGPLHRAVQDRFESVTGCPLVEGYGLTEASPVVSVNPLWCSDDQRRSGSIGIPLPGTKWRIVDKSDPTIELGIGSGPDDKDHIGEIAVCGPQVMQGYLDNPEETASHIIDVDGENWLLTGDIGFMNPHGQVTILDRKKELIKFKGYSVFPKDVENLVGKHECISEIAVAGLPDADSGEVIKAWVVLKESWKSKITEDELIKWCMENITHYKVPKYIEFIDEIPKNMVGKVLRRLLRENDPIYQEYFASSHKI